MSCHESDECPFGRATVYRLEKLVMTVHFYIHIESKKKGKRGGDICNSTADKGT